MARPSNVATQWSEPDGGSADGSSTYHWLATRTASPDGAIVPLGAIRMLGRPPASAGSAIGRAVEPMTLAPARSTTSIPAVQPAVPWRSVHPTNAYRPSTD